MRSMQKLLSIVLLVCMTLSIMPITAKQADAAGNDNMNVLDALGIGSQEPNGYNPLGDNPYGVDTVTVSPVLEVYHGVGGIAATLYGHDQSLGQSISSFYGNGIGAANVPNYDGYATATGDFTNDGLAGQLVTVAATLENSEGTDVMFDIFFTDPTKSEAYPVSAIRELYDFAPGCFGNKHRFDGEDLVSIPYQLQNYLQIAAGDFTGDGIDEIAVYIPEAGKSRVEVYQLKLESNENAQDNWQDSYKWEIIWTHFLNEDPYVSNMISLTAGDMTGDGVEDLAITWGAYYGQAYKTSCQAVVLHGDKQGNYLQENTSIDLNYSGSEIVRATLDFGDADGDGKDELVLGGQLVSDIDNSVFNTRFLALYEYNVEENQFVQTAASNAVALGKKGNDDTYYSSPGCVANLAIVKQDGPGTQEYVYLDSVVYKQQDKKFVPVSELDEKGMNTVNDGRSYVEYGAIAGDFNGDGKETLLTMQFYKREEAVEDDSIKARLRKAFWWLPFIDFNPPQPKLAEANLIEVNTGGTNVVVNNISVGSALKNIFAAPDTDTDTTILKYSGKHYLTYSDPKVLAVLASPPYFNDLAHLDGGDSYIGNSSTTYATISGSSSSDTTSSTINAGAYVAFEQEFSFFGIKAASVETELEYSHGWTTETEKVKSMTQTIEYGTMGGQDTVVLYSLPMDVYIYDAFVPTVENGNVTWKEQKMTVNIPYNAVIKTFTLDDYDAIASQYSELPTVGGNVLKHTLGNPATYPASTDGYTDVNIVNGDFIGIGYGSGGYISQTLEITEENSVGKTQTNSVSFKAGGGAGGFTAGVTAGYERGSGSVKTNLTGKAFSTTVVGMPEAAKGYGYNCSLKVFQYTAKEDGQEFPVVNYLVDDVNSPPQLPKDFDLDVAKTTANSITLSWSASSPAVAGYQIFKHYTFPDGSGDYPIGEVIDANDSKYYNEETNQYEYYFTESNLNPYTEYQYRIQVINGVAPYYSVTSDLLTVRTKAAEGQPTITLSKNELTVYPDRNETVEAYITNDASHASEPLCQWQKLVDGMWQNISSATSSAIEFSRSDYNDTGYYRLRVNQFVGDKAISAYSDILSVDFKKREASIETSINAETGNPIVIASLANTSTLSSTIPTGFILFDIKGNGYAKQYSVDLDNTGTATLSSWQPPSNDVYQITASYGGNRVFNPVESDMLRYLAGAQTGYSLEMLSNITYGEQVSPEVLEFSYEDGAQTQGILEANKYTVRYYRPVYTKVFWFFTKLTWEEITNIDESYKWQVGSYKVEVTIDNGPVLTKEFAIVKRPITITAPTDDVEKASVSPPILTSDLITEGSLANGDSIETLGLVVRCYNTAGDFVNDITQCPAGVYTTKLTANGYGYKNYNFSFIDGIYKIIGEKYAVNGSSAELLGYKVGDVQVISPENHDNIDWTTKYQASTEIVFSATPYDGYEVEQWRVNGIDVPVNDELPNVLPLSMPAGNLDIEVIFKIADNELIFEGENGQVVCTSSEYLQSGATVIKNAEYSFKAVPNPGYHFKEWQLYTETTSYPNGGVDADGYHTYDFKMGGTDTKLKAIFERDSYVLTLGDNLVASYLWDDDDDNTTPMVKKYVSSGSSIVGDTEIIIEPATGYLIASETLIDEITQVETTNYLWNSVPEQGGVVTGDGQSYTFTITEPTTVSAVLERQKYNVVWHEELAADEVNTIVVAVDGQVVELNKDEVYQFEGGSEIVIIATPAYGVVFDEWIIGSNNETTYAVNGNTFTCSALGGVIDVTAKFKANEQYTLGLTNGLHGSLSAILNGQPVEIVNNELKVYKGDNVVLTATPDSGFMVKEWSVNDATEQSRDKTYTLQNITSNINVNVNFAAMVYYDVTFNADANGSITAILDGNHGLVSGDKPGGGSEIKFTATPNSNYMVDKWSINGVDVLNDLGKPYVAKDLVIDALAGEIDVLVTFRDELSHNIMVSVEGATGATYVSEINPNDYPSEDGKVRDGAAYILTVTPTEGYNIENVTLRNNVNEEVAFSNIKINDDESWTCSIDVVNGNYAITIEPIKVYQVELGIFKGGSVTVDPLEVAAGETVLVSAKSNSGYNFNKWTAVDNVGNPVQFAEERNVSTTFVMPESNVVITPSFERIPESSGGGGFSSWTGKPLVEELKVKENKEESDDEIIITQNVTVKTEVLALAKVAARLKKEQVTIEMPAPKAATDDDKTVLKKAKLTLTPDQVSFIKSTGLKVKGTEGTQIEIPTTLLNTLANKKESLKLETYKVDHETAKSSVEEQDEVYHAEEINTNFSGKTKLRFNAPTEVELELLKIKVMHSDGTEETIVPEVVEVDGKSYLEFTVDKFSTFIVYKPGEKQEEIPVEEKQIELVLNNLDATVNGENYQLAAAPFVKEGTVRTLVPIRFVSEALGAVVNWLPETRQVQIVDGKEVLLTIDSAVVLVDGEEVTIDCAAEIFEEKTYVPLRFVSETLGASVDYDSETKKITIKR